MANGLITRRETSPRHEINLFDPLLQMRSSLDRMMGDFFALSGMDRDSFGSPERAAFRTKMNFNETDSEYKLEFELPGVKKDEVEISLEGNNLVVQGTRFNRSTPDDSEKNATTAHRVESTYGSFRRTMSLPENADTENVKAKFEDGMLYVTLPKEEGSEKRKTIAIEG